MFKRYAKYQNIKTEVDGIRFDSKREASRYKELKMMEKAGLIHNLELQKKFLLIPAQREQGTEVFTRGIHKGELKPGKLLESECSYYADFAYFDENDKLVVEDTKGVKTPEYIIKRKLMLRLHDIRIKEV